MQEIINFQLRSGISQQFCKGHWVLNTQADYSISSHLQELSIHNPAQDCQVSLECISDVASMQRFFFSYLNISIVD